jgi:hypothetical protein
MVPTDAMTCNNLIDEVSFSERSFAIHEITLFELVVALSISQSCVILSEKIDKTFFHNLSSLYV